MPILSSSKKGTSIFPLLSSSPNSTALEIVGTLPQASVAADTYYQRALGFCLGMLFATVIHQFI